MTINAAFCAASYPWSPLVRACERSTPARFASLFLQEVTFLLIALTIAQYSPSIKDQREA